MLAELEKIYEEKKYKNMSLILNGTEGSAVAMDTVMAIDMVITTVTAQDTTKVPTENRVGING